MKEELIDGNFLGHVACPLHGGSDSLGLYEKEVKGRKIIDGTCFAECGKISFAVLIKEKVIDKDCNVLVEFVSGSGNREPMTDEEWEKEKKKIESLEIRGWRDRGIGLQVCEKYGVYSKMDADGNPTARYYPVTKDNKIVGYKMRKIPKDFQGVGNTKNNNDLFGLRAFPKGGKYLVITQGEEDAMGFAQALLTTKGEKEYWTPCVSVSGGDGSCEKQIKANFEWVNSFDNVILAFDNDESGQEQVGKIARLLAPGKVKVVKFPVGVKDACDLTKIRKYGDLRELFWKAESFSRVDVLHLAQMWDDFENEDSNTKIPFPESWSNLNDMLNGGIERGEVTVIGALTSAGKSSIINSLVYNWIENTSHKVGAMYLEGTKREVVRDLISMDAGVNLRRVDRSEVDFNALKKRFFNNLAKRDQFVYVDHQGSISTDEIFDKLNYLAKAEGCDIIVIDPIQAGVNSSDNSAIIDFMDTLLKFAKETDVAVVAVSHMRKPQSDDPHDVSEYDLMGSSSINQISFNTILISRDKLNEDPAKKNATRLLLVKCRRTGETGEAGWLRYDVGTTHMYATANPYLMDDGDSYDRYEMFNNNRTQEKDDPDMQDDEEDVEDGVVTETF